MASRRRARGPQVGRRCSLTPAQPGTQQDIGGQHKGSRPEQPVDARQRSSPLQSLESLFIEIHRPSEVNHVRHLSRLSELVIDVRHKSARRNGGEEPSLVEIHLSEFECAPVLRRLGLGSCLPRLDDELPGWLSRSTRLRSLLVRHVQAKPMRALIKASPAFSACCPRAPASVLFDTAGSGRAAGV